MLCGSAVQMIHADHAFAVSLPGSLDGPVM
jgi:hypothetical protein